MGLLLSITAVLYTDLGESLAFFVLTGFVPIINVTIPPVVMLVFWIAVVPVVVIASRLGSYSFWGIIDMFGELSQRSINRKVRWSAAKKPTTNPVLFFAVIVLLHTTSQPPADSFAIPELAFRRRFMNIPASA